MQNIHNANSNRASELHTISRNSAIDNTNENENRLQQLNGKGLKQSPNALSAQSNVSLSSIGLHQDDSMSEEFHSCRSSFDLDTLTKNMLNDIDKEDEFFDANDFFEKDTQASSPRSLSRNNSTDKSPEELSHSSSQNSSADQPPDLLNIGLKKGSLEFKSSRDENSPHTLAPLLKETLGRSHQKYSAIEEPVHSSTSSNNEKTFLLLDKKNIAFKVKNSGDELFAIHTSRPLKANASQNSTISQKLDSSAIGPVDNKVQARATGTYEDSQGNTWHAKEGTLSKKVAGSVWQTVDKDIKSLCLDHQSQCWALKEDNSLVNLSKSEVRTDYQDKKTQALAFSDDGKLLMLNKEDSDSEKTSLLLHDANAATKHKSFTLGYADNTGASHLNSQDELKISAFTQHKGEIFALDQHKNLITAKTPQSDDENISFTVLAVKKDVEKSIGKGAQLVDIDTHQDGSLMLYVKDKHTHLHNVKYDQASHTLTPQWNLSDVLDVSGRNQASKEVAATLKPQHYGTDTILSHQGDNLYYQDKVTKQWNQAETNVSSLQRGLDGRPYILKEGEVKTLNVEQSSKSIGFGSNNALSLTKSRGEVSAQEHLKDATQENIKSFAVINSTEHFTLDDKGELTYSKKKPGSSKVNSHQLSTEGLNAPIKQLTVDNKHTLYAITENGELFSASKKNVQSNTKPMPWSTVPLPTTQDKQAKIDINSKGQVLLTNKEGSFSLKKDHQWQKEESSDNTTTALSDLLFDTLLKANPQLKRKKDGTNINVTGNIAGFSSLDGRSLQSKFLDRMQAHAFKFSAETPRPLKTLANAVQHNWVGRQGLKPLYEENAQLYKDLSVTPEKRAPLETIDLKNRISKLELGEAGEALKKSLEQFRGELESSAEKRLLELGRHQKIIKNNGELNLDYQPSSMKKALQSLNTSRSGESLTHKVLEHWQSVPPSQDAHAGQLLKAFAELGLDMSHQKTDKNLARNRDINDPMSLSKARLSLDTLTLGKLNKLIDEVEQSLTGSSTQKGINTDTANKLTQSLQTLKEGSYQNSLVVAYTDAGMNSFQDIEAHYDTAKTLAKSIGSDKKALNLILGKALQADNSQELKNKLSGVLTTLKPDDSIVLSRNYGMVASATVIPKALSSMTIPIYPTATGVLDRGYSIEFEGDEGSQSITVTMSKSLNKSASATASTGYNVLPHLPGKEETDFDFNSHDRSGKVQLRAGAALEAAVGKSDMNALIFSLQQQDIEEFTSALTSGKLKPEDILQKSDAHMSVQGRKYSFDLNASVGLLARAQMNLTADGTDVPVMNRLAAGVTSSANIASVSSEKMKFQANDSSKERLNTSNNLLARGYLNAGLDITGGMTIDGQHANVQSKTDTVSNANVNTKISMGINNSIKMRAEVKRKAAEEVKQEKFDELVSKLKQTFTDTASQTFLSSVKTDEIDEIKDQLVTLQKHFTELGSEAIENDEQYDLIGDLNRLTHQALASAQKCDILSGVKGKMTLLNTSHLDEKTLISQLLSPLGTRSQHGLASVVSNMIKEDPVFADVLQQARENKNCYTYVYFGLKEDAVKSLEEATLKGKDPLIEAGKLLGDPSQRRLDGIYISQKSEHNEGFKSPTLFLGGNSDAGIAMERVIGKVNFSYGKDQETPSSYTIGGTNSNSSSPISHSITAMEKKSH